MITLTNKPQTPQPARTKTSDKADLATGRSMA